MKTTRIYSLNLVIVMGVAIATIFISYRLAISYPRQLQALGQHQVQELESLYQTLQLNKLQLQQLAQDWSQWDDMYQFVQNPTTQGDFAQANFISTTYEVFRLIGMAVLDLELNPVFSQGYDLGVGELATFTTAVSALPPEGLGINRAGSQGHPSSGWLLTRQGPASFALEPITDSSAEQPPQGYLLFVRKFTAQQLETLSAITRLGISLEAATDAVSNIPPLKVSEPELTYQAVRQRLITDNLGRPVAVLTIRHNEIMTPSRFKLSDILILAALLLVPVLSMLFVHRVLLRPLQQGAVTIDTMVNAGTLAPLTTRFPVRELELMRAAFNRSVALTHQQQSELTQLTLTDGLTDMPNRRAFDQYSDQAWRQARRLGNSFLLVLLDLDYFKSFNDRLGHPAGDKALQQVAMLLLDWTRRASDMAARIGGEEFALIMLGLTESQAEERLSALRNAVENLGIHHPDSEVSNFVTASIGAVLVSEFHQTTVQLHLSELIVLADKALYAAKAKGRNRVVMEALPPTPNGA